MKKLFSLLLLMVAAQFIHAQCSNDIFFSEYIEGSSNNKALEIYNPMDTTVNLANYSILRFNNGGSTTPSGTFTGNTMLAPGDVYVIANPSADSLILNVADTTSSITFYNGDDAILLVNNVTGDTIDVIGELGVDPGSNWPVGTGATSEFTLTRMFNVQAGNPDWALGALEWDVHPQNTFDSLGFHHMMPCPGTGGNGPGCVDDLFFSEYIEGSSNNKALEIYNPMDTTVDLSNYVLYRFNNGASSPSDSLLPQGMLASDDVFVIANPSADTLILNVSDTTHTITFFNGDDALILKNRLTGDTLDAIGEVGVDPGSSWPVGTGATANFTLVRMISVQQGEEDWLLGATEWDVFASNTFDSLGTHTMTPCVTQPPVGPGCVDDIFFSEYIEGSSSNKALEIYNPMDTTVDLSNYVLYRFNNGSSTATDSLFPQGMLASDDVFVIANPSAATAIQNVNDTIHTITFFNGDDALILVNTMTGDTLDAIGEVGVDPGSSWPVGTGGTSNFTLVRMPSVQQGESDWMIGATQWDVFAIDTFDSLGTHTMNPCTGNPPAPVVSFLGAGTTVDENVGTITLNFTITNPLAMDSVAVDVMLNTGTSTATNGADFTWTDTTIVFPAGSSTNQTVFLPITDDAIVEGQENIELELMNPTNGATIGIGAYTVLIDDNDFPYYPIGTINTVDTAGVADSSGVTCMITGTVYGVNMRPSGLQFTIIDYSGGIGLFNLSPVSGYTVNETDSIAVIGTIGQFNGLTQIAPDSIMVISTGATLKQPNVITGLGENTESDLIQFNNAWLVNPAQWTGSGSGFNLDVTNGTDTILVRVDADVDLYSQPAPTGMFNICGLGGQFDSSNPYTSEYQLLPRYIPDLKMIPVVDLGNDTTICANDMVTLDAGAGFASYLWSNGDTTQSIMVGPGTWSVTATDSNGTSAMDTVVVNGIAVPVASFTVNAGSAPTYDFTNTSTGATTYSWDFGDGLGTSTASDPSYTYTSNGTFTVTLIVTGACGNDTITQDVNVTTGLEELGEGAVRVFPNPNNGRFNVELVNVSGSSLNLIVSDLSGRKVFEMNEEGVQNGWNEAVDLSNLGRGMYFVRVILDGKQAVQRIVIK